MLGTTGACDSRQRSAGSPEGNVASRLSTSREEAVRGARWLFHGVLGARGHMGLPDTRVQGAECQPGQQGSRGLQPPGGFMGTLGWEGAQSWPQKHHFTLVPHRRGGWARESARWGLAVNRQPPRLLFSFLWSFPPLIRQLLGGIGSSSSLRPRVWV